MLNRRFVLSLVALSLVVGCRHKQDIVQKPIDYYQELPPGQLALRKITEAEYPTFQLNGNSLPSLKRSIDNSLAYLSRPSSKDYYPYLDITHARAVATLQELRRILDDPNSVSQINSVIRQKFEVYKSIGAPNAEVPGYSDRVLFTGYYTPIFDGSLTRGGPFQHPIYKRPADLKVTEDAPPGSTPVRYLTRAQIETNPSPLAGQELVWLKSRWEAYIVTIQGSARLRLQDGKIYEIGYNGNNGYDYTSPGLKMVADGAIRKDQLSLKGLRAYFDAHPADMDKYLNLNQRYVFFTERTGGPFGSLNVPVTAFASIATDKSVYPRALAAFLTVPVPVGDSEYTTPFAGFMMDQDTGGAIRAAGRCDIYMGIGEYAEKIAGHQLNVGALYYIAIKPELMGKI